MNRRKLIWLSAAIEAATGLALIVVPDLVANVLLGTRLSEGGIAVARVAGCGLLSLGLACWPVRDGVGSRATVALFVYNLLVALYLIYLRVGGEFTGILLWPASIFHAIVALLLARPAYKALMAPGSPGKQDR